MMGQTKWLGIICLLGCAAYHQPHPSSPVRIEFRPASFEPFENALQLTPRYGDQTVWVDTEPILENQHVESAAMATDNRGNRAVVMSLTDEGARLMWDLTGDQLDRPLAILIDGQLLVAPVVRARIRTHVMITGGRNGLGAEAQQLVDSFIN